MLTRDNLLKTFKERYAKELKDPDNHHRHAGLAAAAIIAQHTDWSCMIIGRDYLAPFLQAQKDQAYVSKVHGIIIENKNNGARTYIDFGHPTGTKISIKNGLGDNESELTNSIQFSEQIEADISTYFNEAKNYKDFMEEDYYLNTIAGRTYVYNDEEEKLKKDNTPTIDKYKKDKQLLLKFFKNSSRLLPMFPLPKGVEYDLRITVNNYPVSISITNTTVNEFEKKYSAATTTASTYDLNKLKMFPPKDLPKEETKQPIDKQLSFEEAVKEYSILDPQNILTSSKNSP